MNKMQFAASTTKFSSTTTSSITTARNTLPVTNRTFYNSSRGIRTPKPKTRRFPGASDTHLYRVVVAVVVVVVVDMAAVSVVIEKNTFIFMNVLRVFTVIKMKVLSVLTNVLVVVQFYKLYGRGGSGGRR